MPGGSGSSLTKAWKTKVSGFNSAGKSKSTEEIDKLAKTTNLYAAGDSKWPFYIFLSPSWRSLCHLKGSRFHHPKKVTKNCQAVYPRVSGSEFGVRNLVSVSVWPQMPLLRSRSLSPDGTEIQDSNHEDWGFQGPVFSKKLAIKIVPGDQKTKCLFRKRSTSQKRRLQKICRLSPQQQETLAGFETSTLVGRECAVQWEELEKWLEFRWLLGGGFNYFFVFTPKMGEDEPILTLDIFQRGLVKTHPTKVILMWLLQVSS